MVRRHGCVPKVNARSMRCLTATEKQPPSSLVSARRPDDEKRVSRLRSAVPGIRTIAGRRRGDGQPFRLLFSQITER
jgi:hypothetical protein